MLRLNDLFNAIIGNGLDKKSPDGETKLYRAVRDGNLSQVKKLLRAGADPDIADAHGLTPLHQAAYWGETEIVAQLIKHGATVNADNGRGWTPLHSAALAGGLKSRKPIIDALKAAGAKDDIADKHGWTASDYMKLWAENADAAAKLRNSTVIHAPEPSLNTPTAPITPKPCTPPGPRH